jgi:fructose-1-phosphate kinase PfkB-like protein
VPGTGNQVHLHYPEKAERIETLRSVVTPLNPRQVIEDINKLGMLILIINSGFDIELSDWRKIVASATIPVWLDIHSLPLSKELNVPRKYLPLKKGKEWIEGVSFIQVNEKELSSMLGDPDKRYSEEDALAFGKEAFNLGVKAVFITMGKEGILVMTPEESKRIRSTEAKSVVDTTGCGDVFCGGAVVRLAEGQDPFTAASFGLELATEAVSIKGIEETYLLALRHKENKKQSKIY